MVCVLPFFCKVLRFRFTGPEDRREGELHSDDKRSSRDAKTAFLGIRSCFCYPVSQGFRFVLLDFFPLGCRTSLSGIPPEFHPSFRPTSVHSPS